MSAPPLPPILHGVMLPVATACGIVSRSRAQAGWAIADARRRAPARLEHLDDADVLWLLLMGWSPPEWSTWIETETLGPSRADVQRAAIVGVAGLMLLVALVVGLAL